MANKKDEFNGKSIRSVWSSEKSEWFFAALDVLSALAEQASYNQARKNWNTLKARHSQLSSNCGQLKLTAADGKSYNTDVLNKAGVLALAAQQKYANLDALVEWLAAFDKAGKEYVLKHKDVDVVEVELDSTGVISAFGQVFCEAHLPVGTVGKTGVDYTCIKDWWKGRAIPASREGLRDLLDPLNISFPQQLLDKSFGLSLSDQYWIFPRNVDLRWADINFFYNPFSEDVGNLLFRKLDWEGLDASAISLFSPDNTSDGVLKKKWKIIDGKRCLIKGGSKPFNQEVANEVLAARICKRLGIPFVDYRLMNIDGECYSVCEDFINGDTELVTAWHIKQRIKKDNNTSDYESLIAAAEDLGIPDVRRRIDMMLTLDYIIVNTDRHYNNFGFVRDANTLEWLSVAPVYDSGTSMWCKEFAANMNPASIQIESKPFRTKHDKQIKLVKDFAWLNLDALDGIEDEFADILAQSVSDPSLLADRNKKLRLSLRARIELLRGIVNK
ncbi:MAG: HipA domain-containing protein [Firmicutes bacterium]|nr:HipA domain-containing protein [Bacillota bacterium]